MSVIPTAGWFEGREHRIPLRDRCWHVFHGDSEMVEEGHPASLGPVPHPG